MKRSGEKWDSLNHYSIRRIHIAVQWINQSKAGDGGSGVERNIAVSWNLSLPLFFHSFTHSLLRTHDSVLAQIQFQSDGILL